MNGILSLQAEKKMNNFYMLIQDAKFLVSQVLEVELAVILSAIAFCFHFSCPFF